MFDTSYVVASTNLDHFTIYNDHSIQNCRRIWPWTLTYTRLSKTKEVIPIYLGHFIGFRQDLRCNVQDFCFCLKRISPTMSTRIKCLKRQHVSPLKLHNFPKVQNLNSINIFWESLLVRYNLISISGMFFHFPLFGYIPLTFFSSVESIINWMQGWLLLISNPRLKLKLPIYFIYFIYQT